MAQPRSRSAPPRVLADRFELREVLGTGGMATVWSAHDRRLGRTVAVKVLRDDLPEDHTHRIQREARAAARIHDPRVVTVLDLDHDEDGVPFLVLEAFEGRTLADELREGPLSIPDAERLADDLLGALAAAHDHGVLHRDVKPSNVLRADDGYRVGDFGIASFDDDSATEEHLVGTLIYVAPERFDGRAASPRADVFSAGAVLYEAITGRQPFRGANTADSLERLRSGQVDPLPDHVPAPLATAIAAALDPDPQRRPADAGAFARMLSGAPLDATAPIEIDDPTERLDGGTRVLPVAGHATSSSVFDDAPATDARAPRPAPPRAAPGPWERLRDDPRAAAIAERVRQPQFLFITFAVLLLLAALLVVAVDSDSGDGGSPPAGADPAAQLDAQLDRIEELGR